MKSVIVVFLDGVGLGDADSGANPFMHAKMPGLISLLGVPRLTREFAGTVNKQAALLGLDTTLGVPGLPQSGTGQTAILTGCNAPALLGKHFGPYANPELRQLLSAESLFHKLKADDLPVVYANAYPHRFLDRLSRGKGRLSANTLAAHLAGLKLRNTEDLQAGRAIPALLTNEFWPERVSLPPLSAYQSGQQLAQLAADHALTFFEFWYTDHLGHKQDRERSVEILARLDEFLDGILGRLDWTRSLLLVVSDHGNFEDWTTKKHTFNPALTILAGNAAPTLAPQLNRLTDVQAAVLSFLRAN
jgi:hypothetical protein